MPIGQNNRDHHQVCQLKVPNALDRIHRAQCLNYLRASKLQVGLVINFGLPNTGVKRVVTGF